MLHMLPCLSDPAYHPSLAAKLLELCPLQPGQTVLDLACGTGHLALPAATAVGPTGRVVGVDLSPAMLQQATDKAATQGVSSTTMFVCGDIESLQDSLPVDMQVDAWLARVGGGRWRRTLACH